MKSSLLTSMKRKLSAVLSAALLGTTLVPAAAGAAESGVPDSGTPAPAVTETVYRAGAKPPAPVRQAWAPSPLSWNLLQKLTHGYWNLAYATYDSPYTRLSSDERFLSFMAYSVEDDQASGQKGLLVEDRSTGAVEKVKLPDLEGSVIHFDMTPDGRYFAYSYADSFISGKVKVYWYDRITGALETVNGLTSDDSYDGDLEGNRVSLSADGRYVTFETKANLLVPGDENNRRDVYLYDRLATGGNLQRISVPLDERWPEDSWAPVISGDGSTIAFSSRAKLADDGTSGDFRSFIYVYDRTASGPNALTKVAQGTVPSISGDGKRIAFTSPSDNLVSGDTNFMNDIYVYDRTDNSFARVSREADGSEHNVHSANPSISRNGLYVAYEVGRNNGGTEGDIFVADTRGVSSKKLEVPGSTYRLSNLAKRPTVNDTGNTVTFFAQYWQPISGTEIELYDYFIATNGTAPEWAPGSALEAKDEGKTHITLSWPQASDPDGVAGYVLYKDSLPAAYVPSTGAASYTLTLTDQVREEDRSYMFQVDAVDTRFHSSFNGPIYMWESDGGGENPGELPAGLTWIGERTGSNGPLVQGSAITLHAQGTSGREAKVDYTYKEWAGDSQVLKSASLKLKELAASGLYTGSFKLTPDTAELTSLKLTLAGGGSDKDEEVEGENLPIPVEGRLKLSFTGATAAELQGSRLSLWNPDGGDEVSLTLDRNEAVEIGGLWPSESYYLSLRTPDHREELASVTGIRVQALRTNEAAVPVKVPARVQVQVVNAEGRPVPRVPVNLWDENRELITGTHTGDDGLTYLESGLHRGQTITAELDLSNFHYELPTGSVMSIKLEAGDNTLTIPLISPDRGWLELTVKDPENKPVMNAYVSATQTYKGRPVVAQGRTSLDGKVRLEVFAWDAVVEAAEHSYQYSSEKVTVQVKPNVTTALDLPVKQPDQGVVNLQVFKKALDTEWHGPLNMANENFLSQVESKYGWVRTYYSNAVRLGGGPGTPVSVCISGSIYGYVSACTKTVMDEQSNATAEVRLEEKGARVQGKVEISRNINYLASVYEIKPDGSKAWVASAYDNSFNTDPFNINIPRGGRFRLEITKIAKDAGFHYRYEYANRDFSVAENQILNLGAISFSPTSYFTRKQGNEFAAPSPIAVPGGTVLLRASYMNNNEETAENAMLLLDIPEGMELLADAGGTQAVTGAKGPVSVEGQTLRVPLGNLAKDDKGTVTYKLSVSPSFQKSEATAAARLQTKLGQEAVAETIGTVHLETPKVTLDAPDRISGPDGSIAVTGYAPAGGTVDIYDTNVKIGGATANAKGIWKAAVTLADLGSPSLHALWARTEQNQVALQSEKVFVEYDHSGPQLTRMAFSQAPLGRWVTVDIGKETPDFAYTVVPGNPFTFDFEFNQPDQVENVRVYLDGQVGDPIPALREGGLFRATVPTGSGALGGIYVDYDIKKQPLRLDGTLPNLDQVRAELPPDMKNFNVVSMKPFALDGGTYSGEVVLQFPDLHNMKLQVKLNVNPDSGYQPTAEEIKLAELTGVPAIMKTEEFTETDTSMTVKMEGYMPSDLLSQNLQGLRTAGGVTALAKAGDWGHTAQYFMEVKAEVDGVKGHYDKVKGQFDSYMGYAKKINKIMYNVETSGMDCLDEMPTTAKKAGKALAAVILGEVAKTAMKAGVAAMSLTGPPAAVAGKISGVISGKIDSYVDEQIDSVGRGYNECSDNPDNLKKGRKISTPKWIYDPSGYVYEAVKSNPVEGVTATVLYLDTASGTWKKWDAEEYDQINPQQTDQAGKYGWDVPPGKWKVVWTKDGYETLSSAELDVPPPHTEVNAGLVSKAAPKMDSVTGVTYDGGSYVEIVLSKYVRAHALTAQSVQVTDGANAAVAGAAEFVRLEESAADGGVMLSRTVRFTPKTPLAPGGTYRVKLNRNDFVSYAHTVMLEQDAGPAEAVMKALDTAPPVMESAKLESGGRIVRLIFNEPIQPEADAARFLVNGTAGVVLSAVGDIKQGAANTRELLLSLGGPVSSQVELTLLENAVRDLESNRSAAGSVPLTPDLNPNLSGLTVGTGTLAPAFDPEVTKYVLKLPAGTKELEIKATAADAGAKLTIGSELAASGLAKQIAVPEDGMIPITVSLGGGVAVKDYVIQVSYAGDVSTNHDLSALTVNGGELKPAFNAAVTSYSVELAAGTAELAVTATVADAKSKLTIGGEAAVSGVQKTVKIPTDRVVRVAVESEAGTVKEYTIEVKFRNAGGGSSGGDSGGDSDSSGHSGTPSPAAPAGKPPANPKDPANLGADAVMEKKPNANGGVSLKVSIAKQAVDEALKDGAKSKVLYIEVKDPVEEVILEFPAQVLGQLEKAEAALQVKTELMNVKLDPVLWHSDFADGATVRFVLTKLDQKRLQEAAEAARKQHEGLRIVSDAVTLAAEVVNGGKAAPIPLSSPYTLQGEFKTVSGESPEVYRFDEEEKAWVYVRSKRNADGKGLVFTIDAPGTYAAMTLVSSFRDTDGHWAEKEIETMSRRLLVNGVTETEFSPEVAVTRAEFAAMLVRALGIPGGGSRYPVSFTDVKPEAWYYDAVLAAASGGLVDGVDTGRFAPDETITREQMAVMIERAYKAIGVKKPPVPDMTELEEFDDGGSIQSWAQAGVALALQEGFMQGMTDDAFVPAGAATRAQATVVLGRLLDKAQ